MLTAALQNVVEFHRGIGAAVADQPVLLAGDPRQVEEIARTLNELVKTCERGSRTHGDLPARLALSLEELAEFVEAHLNGDVTAMMDAVGDRLYVLLGDALATGTPLEQVFAEVHRSNMTKVGAGCTTSGKAVKTVGYVPPRLDNFSS